MPELFVIAQNVVNLYAAPNMSSGMVSQVILGDRVAVTDRQEGFCSVTTADTYQGWLAQHTLAASHDDPDSLTTTITTLFADVYSAPDAHSELLTKLVVTSPVVLARRAGVDDWVPLSLPDGALGYVHQVSLSFTHTHQPPQELDMIRAFSDQIPRTDLIAALGRNIAETAKRFIGTPYLWGGCTPFGLDCSGLTQLVYKLNGIQLLRDAHQQWADKRFVRVEEGQTLETALLEDGDLVVFSRRPDKRPTHIGLALGDGRFLHARGGQGVRIDDNDSPEYGETYLGAIRLSPSTDFTVDKA
jgi:hypothetical protein